MIQERMLTHDKGRTYATITNIFEQAGYTIQKQVLNAWNLDFISEEDFKKHVRATIMKYGEKLESYNLKRFNSNLIDPQHIRPENNV